MKHIEATHFIDVWKGSFVNTIQQSRPQPIALLERLQLPELTIAIFKIRYK